MNPVRNYLAQTNGIKNVQNSILFFLALTFNH